MTTQVTDNTVSSRFELEENGHVAFADYRRKGSILYIDHVEAPLALRGTGTAGRLMQGLMESIRAEGKVKVAPVCSYAISWLMRHTEFADMIAS